MKHRPHQQQCREERNSVAIQPISNRKKLQYGRGSWKQSVFTIDDAKEVGFFTDINGNNVIASSNCNNEKKKAETDTENVTATLNDSDQEQMPIEESANSLKRPDGANKSMQKPLTESSQERLEFFKLNSTSGETRDYVINVDWITQRLVDAVSLGNAALRNSPFARPNPRPECEAIVDTLSIYADQVPPEDSIQLFKKIEVATFLSRKAGKGKRKRSRKRKKSRLPQQPKIVGGQVKSQERGWIYVSRSSDFFSKFRSRQRVTFERKMLRIMKAATEVNTLNWTLSEVGYILGFWLAKLYTSKGIPEERLPTELVYSKENFLHLHGLEYDSAIITK